MVPEWLRSFWSRTVLHGVIYKGSISICLENFDSYRQELEMQAWRS
jgi:hypothetical protein